MRDIIKKILKEETSLQSKLQNMIDTKGIDIASTAVGGMKNVAKILNLDLDDIKTQEMLVKNFDEQVRTAEMEMVGKANDIKHIKERQQTLKKQFRQMLIHAYKNRNKLGKLMFVFSAKNYSEALQRNNYIEKMKEIENYIFEYYLKY
jgi:hypothetical protein